MLGEQLEIKPSTQLFITNITFLISLSSPTSVSLPETRKNGFIQPSTFPQIEAPYVILHYCCLLTCIILSEMPCIFNFLYNSTMEYFAIFDLNLVLSIISLSFLRYQGKQTKINLSQPINIFINSSFEILSV